MSHFPGQGHATRWGPRTLVAWLFDPPGGFAGKESACSRMGSTMERVRNSGMDGEHLLRHKFLRTRPSRRVAGLSGLFATKSHRQ